MNNDLGVSVIIPTYNRGAKVLNALKSLENQAFKNFEVIIVNDGSTDDTKEILDAQAGSFNLSVRVIHQENGGRAKVRNRGAKEAKGELLIFMDDDMRHNEQAIGLHVNHHLQQPDTILVGNQVEDTKLSTTDFQKYKACISEVWSKNIAAGSLLTEHNLHITAANFSISKSQFFSIGGFDEALSDTEDYDLAMRAFVKGIPIYYNPDIIGWHDDRVTCNSYIKRLKQYERSHEKLQSLKPSLYAKFYGNRYNPPTPLKKSLYKVLKGSYWINWIDADRLFFLPKAIRYKLYSAIIHSNGVLH